MNATNNVDLTPTIRKEGETVKAFKKRRAERDQLIKSKLKPKPFYVGYAPYVRPKKATPKQK